MLVGYTLEELRHQPVEILVPGNVRTTHGAYRTAYQRQPTRRSMGRLNDLSAKTKDGEIIPVDIALSPLGVIAGAPLTVVAIRDATAQRTFADASEKAAATDSLTGARGRRRVRHSRPCPEPLTAVNVSRWKPA